jgi:hypothetical protein
VARSPHASTVDEVNHVACVADVQLTKPQHNQVGRAKEKIAEAEKKKKRALDKFVAFVRTAEGLYASTTWDEFEDAFKEEEEFVAVSLSGAGRVVVLDLLSSPQTSF